MSPSVRHQPIQFASTIRVVGDREFRALPLAAAQARGDFAGNNLRKEGIHRWSMADYADTERDAFSLNANCCTIWGTQNGKRLILHHLLPSYFSFRSDVSSIVARITRELSQLRQQADQRLRSLVVGGETYDINARACVGILYRMLRETPDLLTQDPQKSAPEAITGAQRELDQLSMLWGHRDGRMVTHAHYSVPNDTWTVVINDHGNGLAEPPTRSLVTPEALKAGLTCIHIASGDTLEVGGQIVDPQTVNQNLLAQIPPQAF
jgi:hypothetical protein